MEYRMRIPEIPNMGDLLNKDMIEKVFQVKIVNTKDIYGTNISGIGSYLSSLLYSNSRKSRLKQTLIRPFLSKEYYVWGTGFIKYPKTPDNNFLFKNVHICALRGQLSKDRVEKILGKQLDVPLADGGLLADRWVGESVQKKYDIGIIPHFKEQDSAVIGSLKNHYPNATVINLRESPLQVVRQIAECRTVLSSSLHGLIVSDSFHIPNRHIMLYDYGERALGDGYKFADYYSSFGLQDEPIKLSSANDFPTIDEIVQGYLIDEKKVEEKKEQIFNVFPR